MIKAVLFDLDGTFADTAPDLAGALNQLLQEEGQSPLPFNIIRPIVSHGGVALLKLGFKIDEKHTDFERLKTRLLDIYLNNIHQLTDTFEGIKELLIQLKKKHIIWGIVTNKPAWLTDPLMLQMGYSEAASTIISGDTIAERKPHPAPLLYACQQINCQPSECLYVGDAKRDITAGNAAGMTTVVALYGYIEKNDDPDTWKADSFIQHPLEIMALTINNNCELSIQ
ncbi:MAG: HAD-IA family hydrolase [Gammaproteobacteria bacterium]|nr:HAD-IA family hydrolase [Gammaproteobacteria bacterium]